MAEDSGKSAAGQGKLLLIVDDDDDIRGLLEVLVKREGFRVLSASSGEEAIQKLDQKPDGIVLDLVMPGCGGLGVLEHFRRQGGPVPPIIVVTAYQDRHPAVVAAMQDPNVTQCLSKPLNTGAFVGALHRYVDSAPR